MAELEGRLQQGGAVQLEADAERLRELAGS
jgi:hypothetical protein